MQANQLPQGVLGGKAVAKLVLMPDSIDLFGAMSGRVIFEGDIISPLENEWEVAR